MHARSSLILHEIDGQRTRHLVWGYDQRQEAYQLVGQAKRRATTMRPKAGRFFSNFEKCRPEVAGEVITGVAVDYVSMDVRVEFGDSTLNTGKEFHSIGAEYRKDWLRIVLLDFTVGR